MIKIHWRHIIGSMIVCLSAAACQPAAQPFPDVQTQPLPEVSPTLQAPQNEPTAGPNPTPNPGFAAFQTSQPAYLKDLNGMLDILPLLTVGDEVPHLEGPFGATTPHPTLQFALAGIPDGLGIYPTPDGYYVFVNHELLSTDKTRLASDQPGQIRGARVSLFQFTKDWQVIGGRNLIERILIDGEKYTLNTENGFYVQENGDRLVRSSGDLNTAKFCSGYLADTGFTGLDGSPAPVWFAAEEDGSHSLAWAVTPDGTATALINFGKFSREQVLSPVQYRPGSFGKTVLLSTEDTADREIYLYIGSPTPADPNGFLNGDLFVLRVEDHTRQPFIYETIPAGQPWIGRWVPVPQEVTRSSGQAIRKLKKLCRCSYAARIGVNPMANFAKPCGLNPPRISHPHLWRITRHAPPTHHVGVNGS